MSFGDRLGPLTELLMGAAYADDELTDRERAEVRALLLELGDGKLPAAIDARIRGFWPATFDLQAAVAPFLKDPPEVRRRLLFLVSAIIESDDAVETTEDDYLHEVAAALQLPPDALIGLSASVDVASLRDEFTAVSYGQPPSDDEVDVDLDQD